VTGALDAFTDGVERRIDVAEVNAGTFLNDVSLGSTVMRFAARPIAIPRCVRSWGPRLRSWGPSAETPALCLVDHLRREHRHIAVVLVSNNPYAVDRPLSRGTRPTFSRGHLGITGLDAPGDSPLAPGRAWSAPRLEVSVPATVHAGIDGEAVDLSTPPLAGHPPRERQSHEG